MRQGSKRSDTLGVPSAVSVRSQGSTLCVERPRLMGAAGAIRSWMIAIPLVVQLAAVGCYHWVPIENQDFTDGKNHTVKQVQVDNDTLLREAVITPATVAGKGKLHVTTDLRSTPISSTSLTPADARAIADGQSHQFDRLRVGNDWLIDATITWPLLSGFKPSAELVFERRTHVFVRHAINPGPTAALLSLTILGGIGLVALSAWGLSMVRVNSSIAFSPY